MQVLRGAISRVYCHKRNKWSSSGMSFLIASLVGGQVVKGEMFKKPPMGDTFDFYGDHQPSKSNPGEQEFAFRHFEPVIDPSISGAIHYLKNYVEGVGIARAAIIADHFGDETIKILRVDPARVAEVEGLSKSVAELVQRHFEEKVTFDPVAYAGLIDLFTDQGFPRKLVEKLLEHFGSDAPAVVRERPYILLDYPRMGWVGVDVFATSVVGYHPRGLDRQVAAIREAMTRIAADSGHTLSTRFDLDGQIWELLSGKAEPYAWLRAIAEGVVVMHDAPESVHLVKSLADEDRPLEDLAPNILADAQKALCAPEASFSLPKIAFAEETIAYRLRILAETARPLPCGPDVTGLNDEQAAATRMIWRDGVVILEGPPGVGKTYVAAKALRTMIASGVRFLGMAPTGKAAKRLSELLGRECTTIHRALGVGASDEEEGVPACDAKHGRGRTGMKFKSNECVPLDADIVCVDEFSMCDASIGAALMRALAPGTRLLIVGDANQLPSVGPGALLRDMIASGIPTASLTQIQRSAGAGRVVHACHAIRAGKLPSPAMAINLPIDNWVHIEIGDPLDIARMIVDLHRPYEAFPDPIADIQVVSPIRDSGSTIGCATLNRALSHKLNPPTAGRDDDENARFRVGDKVVRTKNSTCDQVIKSAFDGDWYWKGDDYDLVEGYVVNGDMGIVEDIAIEERASYAVVRFRAPDKLVRLPLGESHLDLAYALTCHKAQGSGFPMVVVPVHNSFFYSDAKQRGIWHREWIYTALSRAEQLLVTVGEFSAIASAIRRKTVGLRRTRLSQLIERESHAGADVFQVVMESML